MPGLIKTFKSVDPPQASTNAFIAKFTEISLGSNNISADKNPVIYPVPNDGTFNLNLNSNYLGSKIAIYNIAGRKVYQSILDSESQQIDCKGTSTGTYILKITNASGLGFERTIIVN